MSAAQKQEGESIGAAGDASEDDKSKDVVLRDDEEEESSDEDVESGDEEEDGDEEETDDEEIDSAAEVDDEDLSEEGDTDDEDGEEDEEDDDSEEDEENEVGDEQAEELENADVSSGDENSDRCPICLNVLRTQNIGTPESCDHSFCLECIQEWAKNVNTCPVDRQIFRIILARHAGEEKIFKQFPVEDKQQEKEEEEDDPTYCEVCGQSNREDRLLLCDRCDLGYHCDCLDPPLASVPVHEWFCPDCQQDRNTESEPPSSGRQIARTRVSERVRRLIAEARAERAERRTRVAAMIVAQDAQESDNDMPGQSASVAAVSPARAAKKKTTSKRKTTRRKTTKRKRKRKTSKKTGKKAKTRRKRKTKGKGKRKVRKIKKRASSSSSPALARTAFFRAATSVKGRIADKLGLSKPPAGRSIPMQKLPQSGGRQEGTSRSSVDHTPSSFSLLGSRDELYLFADQEGEERHLANRPAIPAESLLSKSAKSSHRPLSFSPIKRKVAVKEVATNSMHVPPSAGGFDLLGSIMQNQALLYKGSQHVTINRDGSLTAINKSSPSVASSVKATTPATGEAATASMSSTDDRKYSHAHSSSTSPSPTSLKKPSEMTSTSKLKLSKSGHSSFSSSSKPTAKSESERSPLASLSSSSQILNPLSSLTAEISKFADAASSDEDLQTIDALDDLPLAVKKESVNNCEGTAPLSKAGSAKSASYSLDNSFIEGTQTFNAVKSEGETEMNGDTNNVHYGISHAGSYNEDLYNSNRSSSNSTGLGNGAQFRGSFADMPVAEQESKPSIGSESLSNGTDHGLSSNNSHEIGSRESDSVLTANVNDSSRLHSLDVNSGVVLEADAVYSNNARLNAEEDVGNNSIGFSRTASSATNLRNFAAVGSDLNNAHDESLSAMKRNFNLLVSTSSNLAGYESGEENDNIEGFMHLPNDREEGEASDSNEEGEVRDCEERQGTVDEQEEGEIVEEGERDRWVLGRNTCEENHEEDSGGLDVNAIHIEEMEIGTFRKRSMSQNEDNEGNKKMRTDEEATLDTGIKQDSGKDDGSRDEDGNNGGHSFLLSGLLTNFKTKEVDKGNDSSEEGGGDEEGAKENEDLTMKPISILDFIGDASAKKFGLPVVDKDLGNADHNFGHQRRSSNFAGANSFGHRGSRPYVNRQHSHKQRERNDDDIEDGRLEMEANPQRIFDRRRGSWQEEDRSRRRSGSQDSQGANERSGSHDIWSSKPHHGRKKDSGRRRRDDEGRDRSRKSRSHSGSPRRRAEKRRKVSDHEGRGRHTRKGKRSRWNHGNEDQDSNEEESVEKPNEEVQKSNESKDFQPEPNGQPPPRAPDIHQHSSGHYQPHQYLPGVAAFSYSGTPPPPLASSHPPAPHSHPPPPPPHPHPSYPITKTHPHAPHPGHSFNHAGPHGQPPYPQLQHRLPVQQAVHTRHPQQHQGYPSSYYPQPHPASLVQNPPPPPPQPYPRPAYPVCYPSQPPRQSAAAIAHPNAHIPNQPHSGYPPRFPPPSTHPYPPPPAPHPPTYQPPRPVAQSTAPSSVFTSAAIAVYQPQQLVSTSSIPTIPHHSYNTVPALHEPGLPRATASLNQEPKTTVSKPPPPAAPETRRTKETVKESASSDGKSARPSYPTSPPTAPIKGVTTYDKVDSSILLNEVKKGFRQLVEDAVRSALRGAWRSKKVTKEEYKDIFKRAVEKVCASKETVVNQDKIQSLVNAYVIKAQKARKAMQTSK